jgi:hypothetical protein
MRNGRTSKRLRAFGAATIGTASIVSAMFAPGVISAAGAATQNQLDICKPFLGCCYSQITDDPDWGWMGSTHYDPPEDVWSSQGADDFSLTANCNAKGIVVLATFDAAPSSFNVTFYTDDKGSVGRVYAASTNDTYTTSWDSDPFDPYVFTIKLPTTVALRAPATYWISVQGNGDGYPTFRDFYWVSHAAITGSEAMWQNPGGGAGYCRSWTPASECSIFPDAPSLDFDFRING